MAAPKRSTGQVEADRLLVAELFVQNYSFREITAKVNERAAHEKWGYSISLTQVFYDIKKLLGEWKEQRNDFIENHITIELAKLDKIEKECWEAWHASKQGRLKTRVDGGVTMQDGSTKGGSVIDRTLETSVGDVRFLDRIQGCIDKRIDLLGLAAPTRSISLGMEVHTYKTEEELNSEINRLAQSMKIQLP